MRVRWSVRRGREADTVQKARLAVALARSGQQRESVSGRGTYAFFALIVVGWFAAGVMYATSGRLVLGAVFVAFGTWGSWLLFARWRWSDGPAQSDRRNRAMLERAGQPYDVFAEKHVEPIAPGTLGIALAALTLLTFYVVAFGVLAAAMDGQTLTVAGVLARGAFFGVFMTIANLTWGRRRHQRATRQPA